jgi:hypothetical protein
VNRPNPGVRALLVAGTIVAWWIQEPFTRALAADNQLYWYMSERVASGVAPYASIVDLKHALAPLVTGAGIAFGRMFGVDDVLASRLVSLLASIATVLGIHRLARMLGWSAMAAAIAATAMLCFGEYHMQVASGARPKVFATAFLVWSLIEAARGRWWRAGVAGSAAAHCWQPSGLVLVAVAAAATTRRPRVGALAAAVGGALALLGVYEAYFWWHGVLQEQLVQSYVVPSKVALYGHHSLGETLGFILRRGQNSYGPASVIVIAGLVFGAVAALHAARHPRAALAAAIEEPLRVAVAASAAGLLAFTFVDWQAYPDLFPLYPFFALGFGRLATAIIDALPSVAVRRAAAAVLLAWLGWVVMLAVPYGYRKYELSDQYDQARQVGLLREIYGPVWAIGCPHLLGLRREANLSRYGFLLDPKLRALILERTGGQPYRPEIRPGVILTARGGERDVIPWLPREYRRLANRSFELTGISIWVRR